MCGRKHDIVNVFFLLLMSAGEPCSQAQPKDIYRLFVFTNGHIVPDREYQNLQFELVETFFFSLSFSTVILWLVATSTLRCSAWMSFGIMGWLGPAPFRPQQSQVSKATLNAVGLCQALNYVLRKRPCVFLLVKRVYNWEVTLQAVWTERDPESCKGTFNSCWLQR